MFTACRSLIAIVAVAFSCAGFVNDARAAAFGDSATVPSGTISCSIAAPAAVTLPVTVDVSSRIFVTLTGTAYNADPSVAYSVTAYILLRDSGDTTTLASTQNNLAYFDLPNADANRKSYGTSTILYDFVNYTSPYVAHAGNYLLRLYMQSNYCTGSGAHVHSGTLSYLLLSSVLDRVFASGFAAAAVGAWAGPLA